MLDKKASAGGIEEDPVPGIMRRAWEKGPKGKKKDPLTIIVKNSGMTVVYDRRMAMERGGASRESCETEGRWGADNTWVKGLGWPT